MDWEMIDGIARILVSKGGVFGTDLSSVATAIASYNVQRYDLEERVHVKQGSWFACKARILV
ncbi:hypothetical protein P3S67_007274 [Capsicum chacoense]